MPLIFAFLPAHEKKGSSENTGLGHGIASGQAVKLIQIIIQEEKRGTEEGNHPLSVGSAYKSSVNGEEKQIRKPNGKFAV